MLNQHFVRPATADRIRSSWFGDAIERYVDWLDEKRYAAGSVHLRVPLLVRFGQFAHSSGARAFDELPRCVEPFVKHWLEARGPGHSESERRRAARVIRGPIQHFLKLIVPNHPNDRVCVRVPFVDTVPGFFEFLRRDRGLREGTVGKYRLYLQRLEDFLVKAARPLVPDLPLAVVSAFITESGKAMDQGSIQCLCSILRTFFRYLYRVGLISRDLSKVIEAPRQYRFAHLPRSITQSEVEKMLNTVDRHTAAGKRNYAIFLLLVTYGLRAREVAALTLDDIDWKRDRLHIRARKADHSTTYPLVPDVGDALVEYLQSGRPQTIERALFFRAFAPYTPMSWTAVSLRVTFYLRKSGINVRRPGSHTLRHTCVQRLVDSGFSLKTIGDFVGHRNPDSTRIYAKVNIAALREIALGNGEEVL